MSLPANPYCDGTREYYKWENLVALMTNGRLWGSDYPVLVGDGPHGMSFEKASDYMRDRALPSDETERVLRHFRSLQKEPR